MQQSHSQSQQTTLATGAAFPREVSFWETAIQNPAFYKHEVRLLKYLSNAKHTWPSPLRT